MELDTNKKYKVTYKRVFDGQRWVTEKIYTEVGQIEQVGELLDSKGTISEPSFLEHIAYLLDMKARSLGYKDMITAKAYSNNSRYKRYYDALSLDKWSDLVWGFIYERKEKGTLPRKKDEWDSFIVDMPQYIDIEPQIVEMFGGKFSIDMLDIWLRQHAEYQKDNKHVVVVDIDGNPYSLTTVQSNKLQKEVGKIINANKKNKHRMFL